MTVGLATCRFASFIHDERSGNDARQTDMLEEWDATPDARIKELLDFHNELLEMVQGHPWSARGGLNDARWTSWRACGARWTATGCSSSPHSVSLGRFRRTGSLLLMEVWPPVAPGARSGTRQQTSKNTLDPQH